MRRFKLVRPVFPVGEVAPYGQVEAATETTKAWGDVDAVSALLDWFRVRTLFREWDYLRGRRIWLDETRSRFPDLYSRLSTKDKRSAAGRQAARAAFDQALEACLNRHGPLGGKVWRRDESGDRIEWSPENVEELMDAIDDLRIWWSPSLTAESMIDARDRRLGERLMDAEASLARVDRAISYGGPRADGKIEAPNLFSVLAKTLHYSRVLGIEYRLCAAPKCGTLFLAKRSDHKLCSNACRQRAATRQKKRARKPR